MEVKFSPSSAFQQVLSDSTSRMVEDIQAEIERMKLLKILNAWRVDFGFPGELGIGIRRDRARADIGSFKIIVSNTGFFVYTRGIFKWCIGIFKNIPEGGEYNVFHFMSKDYYERS